MLGPEGLTTSQPRNLFVAWVYQFHFHREPKKVFTWAFVCVFLTFALGELKRTIPSGWSCDLHEVPCRVEHSLHAGPASFCHVGKGFRNRISISGYKSNIFPRPVVCDYAGLKDADLLSKSFLFLWHITKAIIEATTTLAVNYVITSQNEWV